ncbi:hypothetical protein FS842_004057 [Serendipita sp. 407]|nr:hypothetical protein FS842_004057 [Serendipita sp. 407]
MNSLIRVGSLQSRKSMPVLCKSARTYASTSTSSGLNRGPAEGKPPTGSFKSVVIHKFLTFSPLSRRPSQHGRSIYRIRSQFFPYKPILGQGPHPSAIPIVYSTLDSEKADSKD